MPTARHSAVIDSSADVLWSVLADIEAWPRWLRVPYADRSVTLDPPGGPTLGARVELRGRLPYRLFARIAEWEPERRLALEIERSEYPSDRLFFRRARLTVELDPIDGARTRVRASHEVEGNGVLGRLYMSTLFRLFMRSNVRTIVRSIAEDAQKGS